MRAEIVTIGDEICRGEIVDTNAAWLAGALWGLDITVTWMTSCRDDDADVRAAIGAAVARADVVICSGGLGPTEDDRTVDALSGLAGVDPEIDPTAHDRMLARYRSAGREPNDRSARQVRVPGGARVLLNPVGAAPGFEVTIGGVPVICLPGPPAELRGIFHGAADVDEGRGEGGLAARLIELREARGERIERIARRVYRCFGAGESAIAGAVDGITAGVAGATVHYQVKFPETLVKLVVRRPGRDDAAAVLAELDQQLRTRLGALVYGLDDDGLPIVVGRALQEAGVTLATAESCTGGLIGALLTAVPGSSTYYVGGAITYANEEKIRQLGVDHAILEADGAVSEACVIEMAGGARRRFGVDFAVAVSGIAGPGGGTPDKPVGTVWLAVAGPDGSCTTRHARLPGSREQVRVYAAHLALAMILSAVRDSVG